jgi:hypothetical protein
MLRFRASSVRRSQLLQRQRNALFDIANDKIGSHSKLLA